MGRDGIIVLALMSPLQTLSHLSGVSDRGRICSRSVREERIPSRLQFRRLICYPVTPRDRAKREGFEPHQFEYRPKQ